MTTQTPPRPLFRPVFCTGVRKDGDRCNRMQFKGALHEVSAERALELIETNTPVIEHKCDLCGRVAFYAAS